MKPLTPLPGVAFRIEINNNGWDERTLSLRWMLSRQRIRQIVKADARPLYLDDAIKGLPVLLGNPGDEVKPLSPQVSTLYLDTLTRKGWTTRQLAIRWALTKRRIDQIIADEDRPRYYEDALAGLPPILVEVG